MIGAFLVATALAGEPPAQIPWDTAWIVDTTYVDDRPVVARYPILFITQDKYESEVLGMDMHVIERQIKRELEAVKAAIQVQEKK